MCIGRFWNRDSDPPRLLLLLLAGVAISAGCDRSPPDSIPNALNIEVTGKEFEWHVRYAGRDELLRTEDDYFTKRNITLLEGVPTTIQLKSKDYVYSFALPHLQLKEIAVPDLDFSLEFRPQQTGEFTLKGDQLCGYQHPKLIGKVRVLDPEQFSTWQENAIRKYGED